MGRFVRPATRVLVLGNGDRLTVRERLTAGEQRAMFARVYTPGSGGRLEATPFTGGVALVVAYLLDWDLTDDQGAIVGIRDLNAAALERVLDSLDPESFQEIKAAIDDHVLAMALAREEEKKNGWRESVVSDLIIARRFGWRYEWVRDLEVDVHTVLVEELTREYEAAEAAS